MLPLVVGKLKAAYLASLVIFAGIAIPTSTIALNKDVRSGVKECFDPVIAGINKVPEIFQEQIVDKGKEIIDKYKNWVQDAKLNEKFNKDNAETVTGGLKTSAAWLEKTKEFLISKSNKLEGWAESGNYYTFEFSSIIKSAIDYLPTLSKDTIVSIKDNGQIKDYLSIPKMVSLFKADGVKDFGKGLIELYNDKPNAFKNINKKDTDTIFEIIKSLDDDNLPSFWTSAKDNINEIKGDSSREYKNESENVWKDIFIGKDGTGKMITNLQTIAGYKDDNNTKDILKKLDGVDDNTINQLATLMEDIKKILEQQSSSQS